MIARLRKSHTHSTGLLAALIGAALVAWSGTATAEVFNYCASLDGAQEVPPVATPATGSGTFTIDTVANTMDFNITFSGLIGSESVAHIHGYCVPGVACAARFTLPPGSPKIGTWNYPEANESDILAGLTYANVHSSYRTGGEIRGQIVECPPSATEESSWGMVKTLFR